MKAGDEVRVRATNDAGIIDEISGNLAYVVMDNDVEMEYPLDALILESDYKPSDEENHLTEKNNAAKCATSQVILDALYETTIKLGQVVHMHASSAVIVIGGSACDWESLNAYQKMNFIAMASTIPLDKWTEEFKKNDGSLGRLQLVALAMFAEQMKG